MKYKYLGAGDCDLKPVQDFTLKFSTLKDLNDPYEATHAVRHQESVIRSFVDQKVLDKPFGEVFAQSPVIYEVVKKYCLGEQFFEQTMSKKVSDVLSADQCEILLANLATQRHQTAHTSIEQSAQRDSNNLFGILCLSATCESYLMWSHYANKHQGYCIGFDDTDPWFNPTAGLDNGKDYAFHATDAAPFLIRLKEVRYGRERLEQPTNASVENSFAPYFWKSKDWDYEAEHRMLIPLKWSEPESSTTKASQELPFPKLVRKNDLYVRKFQPNLIKEIVFGVRCSLETQSRIRKALAKYDIAYYFAIPSSVAYAITKEPAPLNRAYDPLNWEQINQNVIQGFLKEAFAPAANGK